MENKMLQDQCESGAFLRCSLFSIRMKKEKPEKTADIRRRHHWFPREIKSEKRAEKSQIGDVWCHYPDLDSASDWLKQIPHAARPIRSATQILVVMRRQYGISAFVSQAASESLTCYLI